MKNSVWILLLICAAHISFAQSSFILDTIQDPEVSAITDMQYHSGMYYALVNSTEPAGLMRTSGYLYLFNNGGQPLQKIQLGDYGTQYFRIISIRGDTLQLIGAIPGDSCPTSLALSEYVIGTETLTHLTTYPLCQNNYIIQRVNVVRGLEDKLFFETYFGPVFNSNFGIGSFVATLDENGQLIKILHQASIDNRISIDFSEKGYLSKSTYFIDFYDRNFNLRKQRYNILDEYGDDDNTFSHPFGHKYILDQVYKKDGTPKGQAIRLLDSNFYIKKLAVIMPEPDEYRSASMPPYGGVQIVDDNTLWTTSNYGYSYWQNQSSYFSVTRLDGELNIICNHFFGFSKRYRIYGITAVEGNGVVVYGWKAPYGANEHSGQVDIFALKVDDNCNLSTAVDDPDQELQAISVYPNPTINSLHFDVEGFDPASLWVEIITSAGLPVFSKKDLTYEIYITELPAGQYFYRILKGQQVLGTGSWVKE